MFLYFKDLKLFDGLLLVTILRGVLSVFFFWLCFYCGLGLRLLLVVVLGFYVIC